MRNRIVSWVQDGLREWVAMTAIWTAGVLIFILAVAFFSLCVNGNGTLKPACIAPAQQFLRWPWLPATALMFLPGMWLWKTWRYTCARGTSTGWAWYAGLLCVPWLAMVVALVLLTVLAAVVYESFVSGETWVNAVSWRLTRVKVHEDQYGVLYRGLTSWGPVHRVKVTDQAGDHWLTVKTARTAQEAVASTFGLQGQDYNPTVQT